MIPAYFFGIFFLGLVAGMLCGAVLATPKFQWTTSIDDRLQQAEQHYPLDAANHIIADYCNNITFHDPMYCTTDWGPRTSEEMLDWLYTFREMLKTRKTVIIEP